ncbi:general amino-acid permease GAP1 [Cordyceps militaris CM01]|uniref:General amino-acid permease GAP1 n=1 Tax=Cordyceps militaris (strain CM01) TaxID=983644 RepID=G3JQI2_CORMM|nr:general amino-acid permease GAP1 [Cordyceps militaris CM01]EGX89486.1 general amino-acid permease GAP1 [Cordyceps militaris CM01]
MAGSDPSRSPSKAGITFTRDFEIVEMSSLSTADKDKDHPPLNTASYAVSTAPRPVRYANQKAAGQRWVDSFKPLEGSSEVIKDGYYVTEGMEEMPREPQRFYDLQAANARTANSALVRGLKGRHLQMIAIGGSIGTGLFVASGGDLAQSGPASLLTAYALTGAMQFCTMQSLAELAVVFPISGSFSAFSTRFLDPSWGFAMGWNYALQWLVALPLEVIAGALTVEYWNSSLSKAIFVTIFLFMIGVINLFGIRGYGEAEFLFSTVKVTAIAAFILLGIVVNIGGTPHSGYIGGTYWQNPGATKNGFKGFCNVLVSAAFAFSGTELVGLAAAETANPRKSIPTAIRQVFWRIALFYLVALLLVTLLVPHNEPRLLGAKSSVDASASPFVIAIESMGETILPSIMNAVILLAVISVGNSAVFGSSRTLAALAEQSHAPKLLAYIDRKGRPLVSVLITLAAGLLAYLVDIKQQSEIFDWLIAICGLSSLFTWSSICLCHIRFRGAWKAAGYTPAQLPFQSQAGLIGSYAALVANVLVIASQFWTAVSPLGGRADTSSIGIAKNFFLKLLAVPIVLVFYFGHKLWFKTHILRTKAMDIDTGRSFTRAQSIHTDDPSLNRKWPFWKRVYRSLC